MWIIGAVEENQYVPAFVNTPHGGGCAGPLRLAEVAALSGPSVPRRIWWKNPPVLLVDRPVRMSSSLLWS